MKYAQEADCVERFRTHSQYVSFVLKQVNILVVFTLYVAG